MNDDGRSAKGYHCILRYRARAYSFLFFFFPIHMYSLPLCFCLGSGPSGELSVPARWRKKERGGWDVSSCTVNHSKKFKSDLVWSGTTVVSLCAKPVDPVPSLCCTASVTVCHSTRVHYWTVLHCTTAQSTGPMAHVSRNSRVRKRVIDPYNIIMDVLTGWPPYVTSQNAGIKNTSKS